MVTEVYIVRHGLTDANKGVKCVGATDVPLNEDGMEQARKLCTKMNGMDFDVIYSSPMSRALDTIAPYISTKKDAAVHMSYGFSERDFGIWENMSFEEIEKEYPMLYKQWQEDFVGFKIPKGESSAEVQHRVNDALDKILQKHEGKKILIVTHLGTARHILSKLLGLTVEESWLFFLENASISMVKIENGKGVLNLLNG